jgi:opacity protein-like surface antigen
MRRAVLSRVAPILVALTCTAIGSEVLADKPDPGDWASERFGAGKKRIELSAGYGRGFSPSPEVSMAEVLPRFGIGLEDFGARDDWYRGNLEILADGIFAFNTEPHSGYVVGAGAALRYNFLAGRRIVPYVDGSVGLVYLDFDLAEQSDGFNFALGVGGGIRWFATERWSLSPELRWQHFSNAGTQLPNRGINALVVLLGASYHFD